MLFEKNRTTHGKNFAIDIHLFLLISIVSEVNSWTISKRWRKFLDCRRKRNLLSMTNPYVFLRNSNNGIYWTLRQWWSWKICSSKCGSLVNPHRIKSIDPLRQDVIHEGWTGFNPDGIILREVSLGENRLSIMDDWHFFWTCKLELHQKSRGESPRSAMSR